jgi:hypothetical protein
MVGPIVDVFVTRPSAAYTTLEDVRFAQRTFPLASIPVAFVSVSF